MIIYFTILLNFLILAQDFDITSKSLSPLLLKNNNILNQNYANQTSNHPLDKTINPDAYIVGPGDKFYLSFSANNFSFNNYLAVSPAGDIIIPTIGLVNVNNLLLKDAYRSIIDKCKIKYNNTDVSITLSDMRRFYINIYGLSYAPSKVLVNPLDNVSDALILILSKIDKSKIASISNRNIKLKRDNEISYIDLLNYKVSGNSYNPTLKEGDEIYLHEFDTYVDIYGGVKNPGRYEYIQNESLDQLISIAGGLTFNADYNDIEISRFVSSNTPNIIAIDKNKLNSVLLMPYDHITIQINKDYKKNNLVYIDGEVNTSGYYVIFKGMTFYDLLNKANGYTSNADTSKLYINNKLLTNNDYESNRIMLISPQKRSMSEISYLKSRSLANKGVMSSNNTEMTKQILDYKINPGDEINIPPLVNYIEIIGGVKNPGRYPYVKEYTVLDYIKEAGGKTKRAKNKIYVINSYNQKQSINKKSKNIYNGETIFVQTKEDFNVWNKFVEILGPLGQLATLIAVLQSASN
tara:strand:+ start:3001 stop:4563 length:1563 start_codon:yes stop_codon:yes gene_type:complete